MTASAAPRLVTVVHIFNELVPTYLGVVGSNKITFISTDNLIGSLALKSDPIFAELNF